jgi:hypothetical protein
MNDDDLSPEARQLVDLARGSRTPTDEQRDRAFQALMTGLGGAAGVATGKAVASKLAGKSVLLWLKWAVPALLVAAAGAGTYWVKARHPAPVPAAQSVAVPSAQAAFAAPPSAASPDSSALDVAPGASVVPDSSAAVLPKAPSTIAKPSPDDLGEELSLLHQALAESRSGHAALELAHQHAQRFPNSHLRVERAAIEVRSLCALGRAAAARKIADRLPNSPVSAALQETCVGK